MKKTIFITLLALLSVFSAQADNAYDFKDDNIYYRYIPGTDDEVEVTYFRIGSLWYSYSGSVVIPERVYSYTYFRYYRVTAIGDSAFFDCSGLTSVTLPNSVTSIGHSAFRDCSGLTSVTIPNSVTSIGAWAFEYCYNLTSLTIGNSVTSIGDYAFSGCSGLTSVTIPESVTFVGKKAFEGCSLTSVTIPESVTFVGKNAFERCSLTSVQWNAVDCEEVGGCPFPYDFRSHNTMTSITFGNQVKHIPAYLCDGEMKQLTSVTIPESVISIGASAFSGCSRLTSVTIPESVTSIGASAFSGCSGLTSMTIPESVISIGASAFSGCSRLTSVTIPESVTSISASAFRDCRGLTSVTIPNSVTSIGGRAFEGCSGLTSVTIPESVTSIGKSAFSDCDMYSVTSLAEIPPLCDGSVFSKYSATLYVPRGCKEAYQTAEEWKKFSSIDDGTRTITLLVNMESMGTVTGCGVYDRGTQVKIEAVPNPGYHFVRWDDGYTTNPRSLTVWQDITLTAIFAKDECTVTVRSDNADRGSVSGGGEYRYGTQVTIQANPNPGYVFDSWDDGNTDNPRTLTVTDDIDFTAYFADDKTMYTVTVQPDDADRGSVSGGGEYRYGTQVTIQANPNPGYVFDSWDDGNTETPRTLTVTGDTTLTAYFAYDETLYTVTVRTDDASMGYVSGGGGYTYGSYATIEAVPYYGYHFVEWSDGNTETYRWLTVTEDITLTAYFAADEIATTYTVSVQSNNAAWGTATLTGNGSYGEGSSVTITATPNTGYRFVNWTKKDGAVFSTEAVHTFAVAENLELTANFEKKPTGGETTYTVTVLYNAAMGTVVGGGEYKEGEQATLAAVANAGYRFDRWSDDNIDNPRILTVTEDITLTAYFVKNTANENAGADNFRVYVQDRTIHLSEERGAVQVYNVAGQCIYNGHATAIPVSHSGLYIVAVNGQRLKVVVR